MDRVLGSAGVGETLADVSGVDVGLSQQRAGDAVSPGLNAQRRTTQAHLIAGVDLDVGLLEEAGDGRRVGVEEALFVLGDTVCRRIVC